MSFVENRYFSDIKSAKLLSVFSLEFTEGFGELS